MTSVHRVLRTLSYSFGRHVEYEDLLAYRDRELGWVGRWHVEIHLRHCQTCQMRSEQIEKDLQVFQKMDGLFHRNQILNPSHGLAHLRDAIHDWEARSLRGSESREPSRNRREADLRRLAKEFDLYLGHQASVSFLLKMKSNEKKRQNPLVEAESVLRDFLGPVAASAITQRIVYLQMSTDRRAQGSLLA